MAIDDVAVRREVVLPVDRETAWKALSDPAELAGWLADEVELRIEEGEFGWLRWDSGEVREAWVEEVVPERRLVLRWSERAPGQADGEASQETLVELVLDDVADGTRLVVLELPVARLEAVGQMLEHGARTIGGPQMRAARGLQMVAALA